MYALYIGVVGIAVMKEKYGDNALTISDRPMFYNSNLLVSWFFLFIPSICFYYRQI